MSAFQVLGQLRIVGDESSEMDDPSHTCVVGRGAGSVLCSDCKGTRLKVTLSSAEDSHRQPVGR